MKIAVYAIANNEESHIDRFCESAQEADVIVVGDTGSSDATMDRLERHGVEVYPLAIMPWRFDRARDAVLALVPADVNICISLDLDEILTPGWRQHVESLWTNDTTRLKYGYDWGAGVVFQSDKIHARSGYHWHHPCHEALRLDARCSERVASTEHILIRHLPDHTKSRGHYLQLLSVGAAEDPHCDRNAIYYARELTFTGLWDQAATELLRYLQLPSARWDAERAYAMRLLGDAMEVLGRQAEALYWYRQGTIEASSWREPFYHLAKALYRRQQWHEALRAAEAALGIHQRPLSYLAEPEAWGAGPWDIAAIACFHLGRYEEAHTYGYTAKTFAPDDERIIANCRQYDSMVSKAARFTTFVQPPLDLSVAPAVEPL